MIALSGATGGQKCAISIVRTAVFILLLGVVFVVVEEEALTLVLTLELEVVLVEELSARQLFSIIPIGLDVPDGSKGEHDKADQLLPVEGLAAFARVQHEEDPDRGCH